MDKDSSNNGGFVLGAILLALGAAILKEIARNNAPGHDFIGSNPPAFKEIPEISKPKNTILNKRLTFNKTQNEVVEVRRVVRPNPLPYHLERGWRKVGRTYQGYYRCRLGAFKGEIEERFNGALKFYVFDPPQQVLNGSHRACFTNNGGNRYHVHFAVNMENVDGGIMAVERVLYQSLKGR